MTTSNDDPLAASRERERSYRQGWHDFVDMLHALSVYFTVSQITAVIACMSNDRGTLYVLAMQNGEYWVVRRQPVIAATWELFKYPPPIPSIPQLLTLLAGGVTYVDWYPANLNNYVKDNGGGESLYLPDHANDNND